MTTLASIQTNLNLKRKVNKYLATECVITKTTSHNGIPIENNGDALF